MSQTPKPNILMRLKDRRELMSWGVVIALIYSLLIMFTPVHSLIEQHITRRVDFVLRSKLGRSPTINPRLKIIAFDDITAGTLQKHDLKLSDWATVLEAIGARKPASIFIDKIWSLPVGQQFDIPVGGAEAAAFERRLQNIRVPIVVGSSVFPETINKRTSMSLERDDYTLEKMAKGPITNGEKFLDQIAWMRIRAGYPYGPHPAILKGFSNVGHLENGGFGTAEAFVRLSPKKAIPHAALLASGKFVLQNGKVMFGKKVVPLDAAGKIMVNLIDQSSLHKRTKNLIHLLFLINKDQPLKDIKAGDVVVILPLMYTGNTDFKDTPLGPMEGGYIPVSIINSALSQEWLSPMNYPTPIVVATAILGMMLAITATPIIFWVSSLGTLILIFAIGILSFSFMSQILPWGSSSLSFLMTGLTVFAYRSRQMEVESHRLKEALKGSFSQDQLNNALQNPKLFQKEPSEQIVSILFVDMVGFSVAVEKLPPREAFDELRSHLSTITQVIHQFGGVIDKNLGDGVLCYFGFDITGTKNVKDHADAALDCAIAIQKATMIRCIQAKNSGRPLFPLRIGINTSAVYIGNVGDANRIDFTLIGHGVNFASRLEGACEPFMIMLGSATKELLMKYSTKAPGLNRRMVQIKHHDELFEAYEYNPFHKDPNGLVEVMNAYWEYASLKRFHERIPIPSDASGLFLVSEHGRSPLINFSEGGFAVGFTKYLAKGVILRASIESEDSAINEALMASGIMPFHAEVRWGRGSHKEGQFNHGMQIKGLNETQKKDLHKIFLQSLQRRDDSPEIISQVS